VVELIHGLSAEAVRANLERVRAEISGTGRAASEVEILAAVKYLPDEELEVLAEAGIRLVGENRAQDLVRRAEAYGERFTWDFIGALQSRKVRAVLPHVRYIHSVASDSALAELERHGDERTEILVQVNLAGEGSKAGVSPEELGPFLERSPVRVVGLTTMPPVVSDPEQSRPYFAALRRLADTHGLRQLSMGTSQDYVVAVQEGATIVRLGSTLYA
jgi:pyridoxal phosphate enzyme (YggS family)